MQLVQTNTIIFSGTDRWGRKLRMAYTKLCFQTIVNNQIDNQILHFLWNTNFEIIIKLLASTSQQTHRYSNINYWIILSHYCTCTFAISWSDFSTLAIRIKYFHSHNFISVCQQYKYIWPQHKTQQPQKGNYFQACWIINSLHWHYF